MNDINNKVEIMHINGKKWRNIMHLISYEIRSGNTTKNIDNKIGDLLKQNGLESAPIKLYSFPGYSCISVNSVVCHGVPDEKPLKHGDVVTIDLSFYGDGYYVDGARNYLVLENDSISRTNTENLIAIGFVKYLVDQSINMANIHIENGNELYSDFFGDFMYSIISKSQYNLCGQYCGHCIGTGLHEEPLIHNAPLKDKSYRVLLKKWDCFCLEPIISFRDKDDIYMTVKTEGHNVINVSGENSFHYENTYMFGDKIYSIT